MMRGIKRGMRRQLCMVLATLMLTTSVPVESLAGVLPDGTENVDAAAVHTETAVDEQQNTDEGAASLIISDNAYEENEEDEQDDPENEEYLPDPMSEEDSLIEETEIEDLSVNGSFSEDEKKSINVYLANAFTRETSWINNREVQSYPENFYFEGDSKNKLLWKGLSAVWKTLEGLDGDVKIENMSALYKVAIMDLLHEQQVLDEELKDYENGFASYSDEKNTGLVESLIHVNDSDAIKKFKEVKDVKDDVEKTGNILFEIGKKLKIIELDGKDIDSLRKLVVDEETLKDIDEKIKDLSDEEEIKKIYKDNIYNAIDGSSFEEEAKKYISSLFEERDIKDAEKFGKRLDKAAKVAKSFLDIMEKINEINNMMNVSDNMVAELKDMRSHAGSMFSQNYEGSSSDKDDEIRALQQAIDDIISVMESEDFEDAVIQEVIGKETAYKLTSQAMNKAIELAWGVMKKDPQLAAVKWGLHNGISLCNQLFKTDDKFDNKTEAYVRANLHRLVYARTLAAEKSFKETQKQEAADLFVNYVYLTSDSYNLMIDNIVNWADELDIYWKWYDKEKKIQNASEFVKKLCARNYIGIAADAIDETENYNKYKVKKRDEIKQMKNHWRFEIFSLYCHAVQNYADQQEARRAAIKQELRNKAASEDQGIADAANGLLQYVESFSALPSPEVKTEQEMVELEKKNDKEQIRYADQNISSNYTLDSDLVTQGDVKFTNGILDLNGHCYIVYGDFYHTGGQIRFHNGQLIILGNYITEKENGLDKNLQMTYTNGKGTLRMVDDNDYMSVAGDFEWWNTRRDYNYQYRDCWTTDLNYKYIDRNMLRKGTIEIGGELYSKKCLETGCWR